MKLVTVVIPCYNYGNFISEAINSVLKQTLLDYEIVIVDDGSDEATLNVLKRWEGLSNIRIFYIQNGGPSRARNFGISQAKSKYILPLDADDLIEESYLEKAVSAMEDNQNLGIVYCRANFFGAINGPWNLPTYQFPDILYQNCIFVTSMFRLEDWALVKGFDENFLDEWEDFDFWLKIIGLGREVYQIPETLFFYRKGHGSRTVRKHLELLPIYSRLVKNHRNLYQENVIFFIEQLLIKNKEYELLEIDRMKLLKSKEFRLGYYLLHWFDLLKNKLKRYK